MEWPKRSRNSHTWGEDKPSDQPTQAKRKSPKWKTLPSRPVQRPWESHDPWKDFHTHLCAIGHPLGRGKERVCSDNPAAKTFFGKGRKNRFRIILHCSVFSLDIKDQNLSLYVLKYWTILKLSFFLLSLLHQETFQRFLTSPDQTGPDYYVPIQKHPDHGWTSCLVLPWTFFKQLPLTKCLLSLTVGVVY